MNTIPTKEARINLRVTKEQKKRLERLALKNGKRLSDFVRDIVVLELTRADSGMAA